MRRILGISAYYHDAAAALVAGGRIASAAQEERFDGRRARPRACDGDPGRRLPVRRLAAIRDGGRADRARASSRGRALLVMRRRARAARRQPLARARARAAAHRPRGRGSAGARAGTRARTGQRHRPAAARRPRRVGRHANLAVRLSPTTGRASATENQEMRLWTTLTTIMVVNGAKSLKPGLSITRSPGRRPNPSLAIQGQSTPRMTIRSPTVMRVRCTIRRCSRLI